MSGSLGTVETLSIIRSQLDPRGYVAGAQQVERANQSMQASGEKVVGTQEKLSRGADQAARAFANLVQRQDPAAKAAVEFAEAQAKADRALRLGLVSAEEHAKVMGVAETRYRAVTAAANGTANAFGVTARQAQQLAPQINDVVTSLLGGASAFQVLAQQGGQVTQAMGGVGNTFRAITGLITPTRLAIAGVAAAMVTGLAVYEGTQRRVATLRGQLRGYADDYEALARTLERQARVQSEGLPGVSAADVTTATGRLARVVTPEDRQNLQDYVALTTDLARSLDGDLSAAISRVTKIIKSPADAARDLAENGVRGFDEQFRRHIELMEKAGDRAGATAEVMGKLREAVRGAAADGSPFQRALGDMSKEVEHLGNTLRDMINGPAAAFTQWMADNWRNARQGSPADGRSLFQMLTGGGQAPAAPTAANPAIAPHLAEAAQLAGLDPELLARVQRREGRLNADGSWATSSAGARGPMQVMPGTFAELAGRYSLGGGIDDPRANTLAGAYYLRERLDARNGSVPLALADYNAGPGRVNQHLAGGPLPGETYAYVQAITRGYGGTGRGAAVPFVSEYGAYTGASSGSAAAAAGTATPGTRDYDNALRGVRGQGLSTTRQQDLTAELSRLQAMQRQAEPNSTAWREWGDAIDKVRAELVGLEKPVDRTLRQMREQAEVAGTAEGFTRDLARAYQQLDETAQSQRGTNASPEERAALRTAMLSERSAGLRDSTAELDRQIEAENRLAAAQSQGITAMQEQAAANRAREEVRRQGLQGTELEAAAIEALTEKYRNLTRAQQSGQVAGLLQTQQQQLQLARDELSTIGLSPAEAARRNAEIQARGQLEARYGPGAAENASGQQYLKNAMDMADLRTQRTYLNEIAGYGREAASILYNGFRAFALEGAKATDVIKNVDKALADLVLRALVMKPLENSLGNLATSLFGSAAKGSGGGLSSLLGGASGAVASAGKVAMDGGAKAAEAVVGGLYHTGGVVGHDTVTSRVVPMSLFSGAPRFHSGGGILARSEFPAILQYGERVLTERQQKATVAAVSAGASRSLIVNQTFTAPDSGAFRSSASQLAGMAARGFSRAIRRS